MSQIEQPTIQLTYHDLFMCTQYTKLHMQECIDNNAKSKYGQSNEMPIIFRDTLQGYLGEQALAKYLNYKTVYKRYDKTANDVLGYEVRTVKYKYAILITHNDDKPGFYVCVSFDADKNTATLKGWSDLDRCNARTDNWRDDWKWPCFGMPEEQLLPMSDLPQTKELVAHRQSSKNGRPNV